MLRRILYENNRGNGKLSCLGKTYFYTCSARPTLHPRALFSDVTNDYRSPAEPMPGDEVTIRLRTGRYNVDKAYLVVDNVEHVMTRVRSESMFDYYEAKINVGTEKMYYYFRVELGRTVCFYNQIGAIKDLNEYYNFQITPGFKTPEWARVQLCTRYLLTDSIMEIRVMMCLMMNITI